MTNFPRSGGLVAQLDALEQRLYALERKLAGSLPQRGDAVVITDGSGRGVIAFPSAFDHIPIVTAIGGNGESITQVDPTSDTSTTGFAFLAYGQNGILLAGVPVRVRWVATP